MASTPGPEDLKVRTLADRYWDEFLPLRPLFATQVGEERFDHLLPDPSPDGLGRRESVDREVLKKMGLIDRRALSEEGRTALDVVETLAHDELSAIRYRFDRFDAADQMWGPGTVLAQLGSIQQADTPQRLERYVVRLRALPAFLAAWADVLRDAADSGQTSPRLVVDRTITQVERLLRSDPAESSALSPVPESDGEGRTRVHDTIRDLVYPAYQDYLRALRDHRSMARETLALSALPGGDEMYRAKIEAWTTLSMEAGEIHERGVQELARIQQERRDVAARVGAPDSETTIARLTEKGDNAFASREELLRLAEEQVRR